MRKITRILLILYTSLLIYWMLFGFSRFPSDEYRYNLVPFLTIKQYVDNFDHFPFWTWLINIVGNIGVFIPFGILMPLAFQRLRKIASFLATFVIGIAVLETSQLLLRVGSFDVDDIILNSIGALMGYVMVWIIIK
ncbi:VanZ family protein [Salinibacillus xinjiangensis]|uniref:VanZ family protein n=1 Tax=Salinibacillus xinjiangensis TaxID=1229268 RepID=UPI001E2FF4A6|nr:VanZ family protein [Salinibacillus xinjiangensis]